MTNTDICNLALAFIGQGRIDSIDEKIESARQCKLHYDHVRQYMLQMHRWGFADKYMKLASLDTTTPGWKYTYIYPKDCLAIKQIYNSEGAAVKDGEYNEYAMGTMDTSTRVIVSNIENAYADYTMDIENADMFSPDFTEALSRGLAAVLAFPLTGSISIQNAQLQLREVAINRAKLTSASESHHEPDYPDKYFKSRY